MAQNNDNKIRQALQAMGSIERQLRMYEAMRTVAVEHNGEAEIERCDRNIGELDGEWQELSELLTDLGYHPEGR
jgi:hypothetical protein